MGNLDIFVIYADHISVLTRRATMRILKAAIQRRDLCLTLVMGDFNFVEQLHDRFNLGLNAFTGNSDSCEAKHWQNDFLGPQGFVAFELEAFTQKKGITTAKLDRIYINTFAIDYAVNDYYASVLKTSPDLSDRFVVMAGRKHVQATNRTGGSPCG